MQSAQTLKAGLFGQELEISGIAQIVQQTSPTTELGAIRHPFADWIGIVFLDSIECALDFDSLVRRLVTKMGLTKRAPNAELTILALMRQTQSILDDMVTAKLVVRDGDAYSLTKLGRSEYEKLKIHQKKLLDRYVPDVRE